MKATHPSWRFVLLAGSAGALALTATILAATASSVKAAATGKSWWDRLVGSTSAAPAKENPAGHEWEGTWYWVRSPDEEKRVIVSLYNRYCIRCHAADGRG